MAAVERPPGGRGRRRRDDAHLGGGDDARARAVPAHEGRAALAFEGRSGLASLRSTLKALGAFESLRSRVDRARTLALDMAQPPSAGRRPRALSSRPSRHGSPVKRMNSAPRLGRGRSSSDAGRRRAAEVPGDAPPTTGANRRRDAAAAVRGPRGPEPVPVHDARRRRGPGPAGRRRRGGFDAALRGLHVGRAREACGVGLAGDGAAAASSCRRVDALVGVPVVGVDCGGGHCVAVTATGEAWAWGRDEHRQCGVVGPLEDVDGDAVLVPGRCAVPPDFRLSKEEHVVPLPEHRHAFHVVAGGDTPLRALPQASDGSLPAGGPAPKGRPFWADGATDLTKDGRKASRVDSFLARRRSATRPWTASRTCCPGRRCWLASFVAEDAPRCDDFLDDYDDDDDDGTRFDDVRFDARAFERCFAPLDARLARPLSSAAAALRAARTRRRKLALAIMAGATRLASAQRDARSPDAARCCVALSLARPTVVASNADDEGCAPPRSGRSALGSHGAKSPAKADDDPEQSGDDDSPSSPPRRRRGIGGARRDVLPGLGGGPGHGGAAVGHARVGAGARHRRGPAPARPRRDVRVAARRRHGRRASLRARLRRPLKFLVVARRARAALDGSLPSGDGVRLSASSDLALQLRGDASLDLMSGARDVVLDAPAALASAAFRENAVGALPKARGAFAAARRACLSMELLRRASRRHPGVPRSEVLESYRVPEVDALGVVIATPRHDDDDARRPRDQPRPQYGAGPGSLLVDFMRWRDAGAPRAGEVTGATASGKWYLSTFSFLAAPATKRELLAVDARRRQGEAGARATMMAPFVVGASLPYLVLRVPRSVLLATALAALAACPDGELKKELKVVFEGEAGVDEGGPRKEFFQLLVPQLFDPIVGMFARTATGAGDEIFFNAACDWYDTEFELAGLLVGLAVYNSVVLEVRLPRVAYKKLLAASPAANASWLADDDAARYTLDDLAELDDDLARGLRMLLAFEPPEDVRETFCRTLVDADPLAPASDGAVVDLVPGGSEIAVTAENRHAYVEALVDWRLRRSVAAQFDRFASGFWRVLSGSALERVVEPDELRVMVQGDEDGLDLTALRPVVVYEGFGDAPDGHPVVRALWAAVDALDEDGRRLFLMFTTGSKTAPMGGLGALRPPAHPAFRIQRAGPDSSNLPTSHTCFNTLLLPDYDPPDKVAHLLNIAIRECEGFGLQ
ncbi:ubiquitin-protein transferase [Aureococcus anophagefferens]|uniref:HECT-type E3 ubiquitin transferase n=2 Tax=Aureococcus anophagefferens TaxID=44056 RepID=A0ABR1FSA3_AURAN